jgi:hypothetical protein
MRKLLLSLPFLKGDLEGFYNENKKSPCPFSKGGIYGKYNNYERLSGSQGGEEAD